MFAIFGKWNPYRSVYTFSDKENLMDENELNGAAGQILNASQNFLWWHQNPQYPESIEERLKNLEYLAQAINEYKKLVEEKPCKLN
jgi:hypothetical protein